MFDSTTTTREAAIACATEAQRDAWAEIRHAMKRHAETPAAPAVDDLDLLRAALAEYVTAARMLLATEGG